MTWDGDPHSNYRCMAHLFMNHTWILWCPKSHISFINLTIKVVVCLIRKPNTVERRIIILSPFSKCLSLMFVLNCSLGNIVILYGNKFKSLFNIRCTDLWISLLVLQPSPFIYWGFLAAPLWQRQCSPENAQTEAAFPLQHWTGYKVY
jgi:hypothetical protein